MWTEALRKENRRGPESEFPGEPLHPLKATLKLALPETSCNCMNADQLFANTNKILRALNSNSETLFIP